MTSAAPSIDSVIQDLVGRLRSAWERSDSLFRLLEPAAWLAKPIPQRHPFAFYAGHLPAFAWNQIGRGALGRPPLDARLDRLFARGIDPLEDAAVAADPSTWPNEREVFAYRDRAREALLDVVGELAALADRDPMARNGRVVQLVVEHELMHHETLLYMVQELPTALKRSTGAPSLGSGGRGVTAHRLDVPAGRTRLGADFERVPFGWDNEFPAHDVDVERFAIDALPVRNAEYAEFVESGGYRRQDLFEADDWTWIARRGMEHPHSWRRVGGATLCRTVFDELPLDDALDWPVQVSFAEAAAYARWRGASLPSEAQFHRAAYGTPDGWTRTHPWGESAPDSERANIGFARWAPDGVGSRPLGASAFGVHELVGNGWEWTRTPFASFAGFSPWARTYPGYSKDFFDGRHRVLLGGSWATDETLLRRSFRNWFQPHYPYVFSKFRCVYPG